MSELLDRVALTEFIRRYSGDFKAAKVAGIGQYFCEQVTTVHDNDVSQYSSSDEFVESIAESLAPLLEQGFSHTVLDEIEIYPLRENSLFVSANYSRLNTEGGLFEKVGASYVVVQERGEFKIAVILGHDLENLVK